MQAFELETLAVQVRSLPGGGRSRGLHRVVDCYAASEAAAALKAAAFSARKDDGLLAQALVRAAALSGDGVEESDGLADDPEALDALREIATQPRFLPLLEPLIRELRGIAALRPETGACTVASALELWCWTTAHFLGAQGAREHAPRAFDDLAAILCPLLAARCLVIEVAQLSGDPAEVALRTDLCHTQAAHASASAAAGCAELVFGYRRHPGWDSEGCSTCYTAGELDALESVIPGIASGARTNVDVIEADGSHPDKAGPCVRFGGVEPFIALRSRLDGCLTGARFARDRAAAAIGRALDSMTSPEGRL